jgi:glycosyltransferase involved in cell wall biosynthesis
VTIACSIGGELRASAEQAGVRVVPLLDGIVKRRLSLTYARRLFDLIRREHFDLVHAHVYASEIAAWLATLPGRVPLVLTEHTEADWRSGWARWLSRRAYHDAAHVIAVSNRIEQCLLTIDRVPSTRVTVIPNGLPSLPVEPASAGLSLFDDHPEGPIVGVVARLEPEKGVAYFLEAAARVAPLAPDVRFVVIGDGPLRNDLELHAERLGLGNRVRFLGLRLDAPALVSSLDLLAVPSLSEGTALRILEAMSVGVPIVATSVGGIPDQIRHGREGLLVPAGDSEALGAAMLELLRDPDRARRLGEAGRQRLITEFDYEVMLQRTLGIFHAALQRSRPTEASPLRPVPLTVIEPAASGTAFTGQGTEGR